MRHLLTGLVDSFYLRAAILTLVFLLIFGLAWHVAVAPSASGDTEMSDEYAAMMGESAKGGSNVPGPLEVIGQLSTHIQNPLTYPGTQDPGLFLQAGYSVLRVFIGFGAAAAVGIPLGFALGTLPLLNISLNPLIQILRPVSPLAWLPLALFTVKDAQISSIFVIFICSIWPILINTSFGVRSIRQEWTDVARTLEVGTFRKAFRVILPAAAPTIMTGMRISVGIAWLVIVAAEMLVGGTGVGYFVWNEWNNLQLSNIISAIIVIGLIGMILDMLLGSVANFAEYAE